MAGIGSIGAGARSAKRFDYGMKGRLSGLAFDLNKVIAQDGSKLKPSDVSVLRQALAIAERVQVEMGPAFGS